MPATSRVFQALIATHERLAALDYGPHPDTGDDPALYFMGEGVQAQEYVHLVGKVDDGETEWANTDRQRVERFSLRIRCATWVPGNSGPDVIRRLWHIADMVQDAFRDRTTGRLIPLDLTVDGANTVHELGGINTVEVDAEPTENGWGAACDLYLFVQARL